ncbi:MAG: 23S rRNA (adenine(2503)-C(2))-methyltransferase RlmN [Balneolaceae bacterium]|nr:MAG: 23S rRNA (adenine(2503)-C(2))-methyltransferase RlmN [Balneolaceae bacterium]
MSSRQHHLLQQLPVDLNDISLTEWDDFFDYLGFRPDSRRKVFEAVFHERVSGVDGIQGLSKEERESLSRVAVIRRPRQHELSRSRDGSYRLTLVLHDGHLAETVIIPEWTDGTLRKCSASISSQIGCFFGCSFCATGRMGFHRNLTTGELLEQVRQAEVVVRQELNTDLTHLYFMGMGEPMHNYRAVSDALTVMRDPEAPGPSPSRITVSTVGLFRQIRMLASDHPEVRLAVSIHSADQQKRYEIMPVSSRLGLPEIRDALVFHQRQTGSTPTIQYLLMEHINDRPEDARKLVAYLGNLRAGITLIMYNDVPEAGLNRTGEEKIDAFQGILEEAGFPVDIRWCYGEDINAGCGQLKVCRSEERVSVSMRHGLQSGSPVSRKPAEDR